VKSAAKPASVPDDIQIDSSARYTGIVGAYWKFKGYGFIELSQKGIVPNDRIFVYWKSLQTLDRYPTLVKGQEVEFGIKLQRNEGRKTLRAKDVTLVGGGNIALQDDLDAQKKTFVGGQDVRYLGTLKFFSPRNGFGYITLDEGYQLDAGVPRELRVETAEVNAGGKQPPVMKDLPVEFGIWQTKSNKHKAYNMTLRDGKPVSQEALENREIISNRMYQGKIEFWMWKQGWGFIEPDPSCAKFPQPVQAKLAQMNQEAKKKGKDVQNEKLLYFRRADCAPTFRPEKGAAVSFQVYTDDKGAGAYDVH